MTASELTKRIPGQARTAFLHRAPSEPVWPTLDPDVWRTSRVAFALRVQRAGNAIRHARTENRFAGRPPANRGSVRLPRPDNQRTAPDQHATQRVVLPATAATRKLRPVKTAPYPETPMSSGQSWSRWKSLAGSIQ